MKMGKRLLSEVGFEPTPSFEDQNTHFSEAKSLSLESGALDRSAILTLLMNNARKKYFYTEEFKIWRQILRIDTFRLMLSNE